MTPLAFKGVPKTPISSAVRPSPGVNVPDHDMTFQSLSELLQQSVGPFVASVQAKECGGERSSRRYSSVSSISTYVSSFFFFCLALKHLMKRVLERLMDTVVAVDDDDDEEEGEDKQTINHHTSVHCSLATLCDWYSSQTKVRLPSSSGGRGGSRDLS